MKFHKGNSSINPTFQVLDGISPQVGWDTTEHLINIFVGMPNHEETQMNLVSAKE